MYPIIYKKELAESIYWMDIRAPLIANRRKPGQFVVIRLDEEGERTPLTIAASDPAKGAITIIFQAVGQTTMKLEKMDAGDELADVVGPLGKPTHMENFGHAVCIGGGLGIALALPIVRGLKQAGNRVTSILSARSSNLLILQDEVGESSH